MLRFVKISCVCDFDYSRFVNERGEHVRCEVTVPREVSKDTVRSILARAIDYLSQIVDPCVRDNVEFTLDDVVELRVYADILKRGLSFYDIVYKLCMLLDYEIVRDFLKRE